MYYTAEATVNEILHSIRHFSLTLHARYYKLMILTGTISRVKDPVNAGEGIEISLYEILNGAG